MNICSAMMCPVNFVAQGMRRLVTTSGSVTTRYRGLDSFGRDRPPRLSVFGLKFGGRRNSAGGQKPFTETPDQVYQRAHGPISFPHIKKSAFLGLSVRDIKHAVPNTLNQNVAPLHLAIYKQFEESLVGGPTASVFVAPENNSTAQKEEDSLCMTPPGDAPGKGKAASPKFSERVYAEALSKPQWSAVGPRQYSAPAIFIEMFNAALNKLVQAEDADLDVHLHTQNMEFSQQKKMLASQYMNRISRLFRQNLMAMWPAKPTVTMQYQSYMRAEVKTLQGLEDNPGDLGRFSHFMSQFQLEIIDASEFRFSRYNGKPLVFDVPTVLYPKESLAPNGAAGSSR